MAYQKRVSVQTETRFWYVYTFGGRCSVSFRNVPEPFMQFSGIGVEKLDSGAHIVARCFGVKGADAKYLFCLLYTSDAADE